jgi:hypothetical protein
MPKSCHGHGAGGHGGYAGAAAAEDVHRELSITVA